MGRDRDSATTGHLQEMACAVSNGHVIDDVTWPSEFKVVILISLRPVISYKIHLADICTLWAPSSWPCDQTITDHRIHVRDQKHRIYRQFSNPSSCIATFKYCQNVYKITRVGNEKGVVGGGGIGTDTKSDYGNEMRWKSRDYSHTDARHGHWSITDGTSSCKWDPLAYMLHNTACRSSDNLVSYPPDTDHLTPCLPIGRLNDTLWPVHWALWLLWQPFTVVFLCVLCHAISLWKINWWWWWYEYNKSSPKSFGKSASLFLRRRMHSPTACASCSLYNA